MNAALATRRPSPGRGRIVLYHHISDRRDPVESVPAPLFTSQLGWLSDANLGCATVDELRQRGFPPGLVGLSFDDGYRCIASACEALLARGWRATIFVVPGWVDAGRAEVLSWGELSRLREAGIEIACHGLEHERLCGRRIGEIAPALRTARERIEQRLGAAVTGFAYPEGLAPPAAREAARRVGFAYACTTVPGRNNGEDLYRLRRNEVLATDASRALFLGKLGGTDDWTAPLRSFENWLRCRA